LKSHPSKSAAVGKFQSIRLNVTTPGRVFVVDQEPLCRLASSFGL